MSYCVMIEKDRELPSLHTLPVATQQEIKRRTSAGLGSRDYNKDIAGNLDKIIQKTNLLHEAVTADEIRLMFPPNIRDTFKAGRITHLSTIGGRDQIVVKVGKKGKEHLFQLKEYAIKSTMS